jgi:hypothetical protein
MKKVFRCLGMMALMALAFTSCKKDQQQVFTATMPDLMVEDEDRAYIDGNLKVHFEIGDRVMIFNISEDSAITSHCATYRAVQDGNRVEFVNSGMGTVGAALDGGYYAYYPSTLINMGGDPGFEIYESDRVRTKLEFGENKSEFYVAPVQEYREGKVARKDIYLAGHTTQAQAPTLDAANFMMKFFCGVLQLKPTESRTEHRKVTEITVYDNQLALSGWVELIIPEIDYDELTALNNNFNPNNPTYMANLAAYKERIGYKVTEASDHITLTMPEGGVELGNSKASTPAFNIVLRPWALAFGSHIVFTFENGDTLDCDLSNFNLRIKPNVVKVVTLNLDAFEN